MIITAFVYAGIYLIKTKRENVCALKEMHVALGMFRAELGVRLSPLSDITAHLAQEDGKYFPAFFSEINSQLFRLGEESFESIWKKAVETKLCCLEKEDLESLKHLGQMLGTYELTEQLNAIDLCCIELNEKLEYYQKELAGQERTCIGICSVLGVLIAVVLI